MFLSTRFVLFCFFQRLDNHIVATSAAHSLSIISHTGFGLSCWHHITHDNRLAKLPSSLRVSVVMTESRPVSVVRCVHAILPDLLPLLNLRLQFFLTQRFQTKPVFHKKAKVTKKITLRLKCKECGASPPLPLFFCTCPTSLLVLLCWPQSSALLLIKK